ncbi:hypothetical protein [Sphingobium algorifonticola]|jgi:hypothetical protein|uniref:hypothetical protein n=1 Tax=Sphingobium algorifonticola TaxID=2008318 RepID=UPI0013E3AADE|nr:hypothetical protein [Sphingobium algorifonticola]
MNIPVVADFFEIQLVLFERHLAKAQKGDGCTSEELALLEALRLAIIRNIAEWDALTACPVAREA